MGVWFRLKQRKRWRGGGRSGSSGGRASDSELMKFCSPPPITCCAGWGWRGEGSWGPLMHHKPVGMWRRCGVGGGEAFSSQVMGSRPLVSLGFWTMNFTRVSRVFRQELHISLTPSHLGSDNTRQVRFWLTSFPCGQAF